VAATRPRARRAARWRRVLLSLAALRRRRPNASVGHTTAAQVAGLLGGLLAAGPAVAIDLPEDRGEGIYHRYDGGGVVADGVAVLVRKRVADTASVWGSYYVDAVSNASIDVVTTASPYNENRDAYTLGVDYVHRDSILSVVAEASREPDYEANSVSVDLAQEVFGGMTTIALGFSRGDDDVGKKGVGFFDSATHWKYRVGVSQILTPRWLAALNYESISDDGFLGSPYRIALVFGAAVPENNPRTRTSQAVNFRVVGDLGSGSAVRAGYRYFWDTWSIKAHTAEATYSRYFGSEWLADATVRLTSQDAADFYSDDADSVNRYISRNRQLSTFTTAGLGAKLSYKFGRVAERYDVRAGAAFEYVNFKYDDFTDVRTGKKYSFSANVMQVFVSATF